MALNFDNPVLPGIRYAFSLYGDVKPKQFERQVATAYDTGIFDGDPVLSIADGSVEVAATVATDAVWGISYWARYNDAGNLRDRTFVPADTTYTQDYLRSRVFVMPAFPATVFSMQADDDTTITTVAAARTLIWENCDAIGGAGGNTETGLSTFQLDISSRAVTATLGWRVIGISDEVDNSVIKDNASYLVINNRYDNWPGLTLPATGTIGT